MVRYRDNDCWLIQATLNKIKEEMERIYWNHHQKEMETPFDNTGLNYQNNVFIVRAYDWGGNVKPNFEYKDLKVWWYKYSNRGTYAECGHVLTYDDLNQMIGECVNSYMKDWKGESPNE